MSCSKNNTLLADCKELVLRHCANLPKSEVIIEANFVRRTNIIYFAYPVVFAELFTFDFDSHFVEQLSIAGFLLYRHLLISDRLQDKDDVEKVQHIGVDALIAAQKICKDEAFRILRQCFDEKSYFWRLLSDVQALQKQTDDLEASMCNVQPLGLYLKSYEQLALQKSIYGRLCIDALYTYVMEHSNSVEEQVKYNLQYNEASRIYDRFALILQILDDIEDVHIDSVNGQQNLINHIVKSCCGEIKDVKKHFYFDGIAARVYGYVINICKEVEFATQRTIWLKRFVGQIHAGVAKKAYAIENYVKVKNFAQTYTSTLYKNIDIKLVSNLKANVISKTVCDTALQNSLRWLLSQAHDDFVESYHFMYFPKNDGFKCTGVFVGNKFQLSIIALALQQIGQHCSVRFDEHQKPIADYFLSDVQPNYRKTWCYLNDFYDLGADVDDMAQMMRFLHGYLDAETFERHCGSAIDFVCKSIVEQKRPTTTWLPPVETTELSEHQHRLNISKWGDTIDIEVMANLLLLFEQLQGARWETTRDAAMIVRDYIVNEYLSKSAIMPRWYYSRFYPIYLLSKLNHFATPKLRDILIKTLLETQNADGSWLSNKQLGTSVIDTAFAVRALQGLSKNNDTKKAIQNGIQFIRERQQPDGSWPAECFIKPRYEDPYASRTVTTIFCIECLLNVQQ